MVQFSMFPEKRPSRAILAAAGNPFADLIPETPAAGPAKAPVRPAGGQDLFGDLIPKDVPKAALASPAATLEGPQTVNVGAKGAMRPGSRFRPDLRATFTQGALLNFADEISAAVGVPVETLKAIFSGEGPTAPGEVYEQNLAAQRAQLEATREAYPTLAPVSEIAGAVSTAVLPAGAALRGTQALTRAPAAVRYLAGSKGLVPASARGAAVGGTVGGVSAFGEGEGLEDRLSRVPGGAGLGAGIGAVAPGAGRIIGGGVRLVKSAVRGATTPIRSLAGREQFAAGKVAEALQRDRLSPQRAARLLELRGRVKPETTLADVGGENVQGLLRAAANVPSPARNKLVRDLFRRQEEQLERLRGDVASAFGDPKTFNQTVEQLTAGRKQAAKPLFDAAFATGTPWTSELQRVLQRPMMRKLVERAREAAANRGEKFKSVFAQISPDGKVKFSRVPDTEALHRIKMEVDAVINQLKRREETGLGNVNVRDLAILKKDLVHAIDNPLYKRALRQYAGDSAAVNAIDEGFEEGLSMEPEAIAKTLAGLGRTEADLWRLGMARKIVTQLREAGGRAGSNRAEILASPKYLDRMRAAFRNTATGKDFMRRLEMERRMFKTRNAVIGNSTTARQLAEGMEAGAEAEGVQQAANFGTKIATGDWMGAAMQILSGSKNWATGLRPAVADEIVRQLTSKDPATVRRAVQIVQRQMTRLQGRQALPGRVARGVTTLGFGAIPSVSRETSP